MQTKLLGDIQQDEKKKQQHLSSDDQDHDSNSHKNQSKKQCESKVSSFENIQEYFHEFFPSYQHLRTNVLQAENQSISQMIQHFQFQTHQNLPFIEAQILQNGVFEKVQKFTNQLLILSNSHTKYFDIITLQIQLSFYKTKITILNNRLPSEIHDVAYFQGFGAFGNVYFAKFLHEQYAIKCIHFDNNVSDQQKLIEVKRNSVLSALTEYFFVLLFSQIRIGPKVKKIFGFDLIVHQNCIEFSTQICQKKEIRKQDVFILKENLKTMHMLKFVHRDIKPGNMMYSSTFRKYVFIDFGSCQCLKESFGTKTFTKFVGTTGFSSPELINLIGKRSYADIYFNDFYGLKKTCEDNVKTDQSEKANQYIIVLKNIENPTILLTFSKYLLFMRNFPQFFEMWRKIQKQYLNKLDEIQFCLLEFLIDIPPSQELRQFYWNQISEKVRNCKMFEELKKTCSIKKYDLLWVWKIDPYKEKNIMERTLLYKDFLNQNGPHNNLEKQVLRIHSNKENMEKFIFSLKDNDPIEKKKIKNSEFQSIQALNQKGFCVIYFLVVVNYSTFVQNHYNCTFENKVKACQLANTMIENLNDPQFPKMETLFQPYSSECQPLIKVFQYFIFYLLKNVPEKFKEKSMTNAYASLLLLGYPIYLPYYNGLILFQFIKDHQSNRVEAILNFWQAILISIHFGNILLDRNKNELKLKSVSIMSEIQFFESEIQKIFLLDSTKEEDSFFNLNHYFFINLYVSKQNLKAKSLHQATQKLLKNYNFQNFSDQTYKKWKDKMFFLIRFLKFMHEILDYNEINDQIIEKNLSIFGQDMNSMPTFIETTYATNQVFTFYRKFDSMFQIIDRIINNENISSRYFINKRLMVAYFSQDIEKLKILLNMVVNCLHNYSILNMLELYDVSSFIYQITYSKTNQQISDYFHLNPKSVIDIKIFQKVLETTLEMGEFYCIKNTSQIYQFINFKYGRNLFQKDKSVFFIFKSFHNILLKLKYIYVNFYYKFLQSIINISKYI